MKPTILIILLLTSSCAVSDWSTRDKHLLAFSIAGTAFDVATTDYAMDHGFKEVGIPRHVMGEHPGTTKLILTGVGSQLLVIWLADWWEEYRPWILGINGGVHTAAGMYNYKQIKD